MPDITLAPDATIGGAVRTVRAALAGVGIDSAAIDAELIVMHATGLTRVQLRTRDVEALTDDARAAIASLTERRLRREPVAYLLGSAPFRRIELTVDARVLVPRPETELLVEFAVAEVDARITAARGDAVTPPADGAQHHPGSIPVRVLDLCTGSGAVALAIAEETAPGAAEIWATDLSADALDVARANGERLDLDVDWYEGDLYDALPAGASPFDVIVANPPYIARSDADSLPDDVREHEPHLALFLPGDDPVELLDRMLAGARERLTPGGALAVEIGMGQHDAVAEVFRAHGFERVAIAHDLAGIGRVVTGWAPC